MYEINFDSYSNFRHDIDEKIINSDIIAFDTEFSGITLPQHFPSLFDNTENRYAKLKITCQNYYLLQLGLYIKHSNGFDCYNIYPKPFNFHCIDEIYSFQPSTVQFLQENEFNFNKINNGIPYISKKMIPLFEYILYKTDLVTLCRHILLLSSIENYKGNIKKSYLKNLKTFERDALYLYKKIINLKAMYSLNEIPKKLIQKGEKLRQQFFEMVTWLPNLIEKLFFSRGSSNIGFGNHKILVGHNCMIDLMFLYQKFIGPLPLSLFEFSQNLCDHIILSKDDSYVELIKQIQSLPNIETNEETAEYLLKLPNKIDNKPIHGTLIFDTKLMLRLTENLYDIANILKFNYHKNPSKNILWKNLEYQNLEYAHDMMVKEVFKLHEKTRLPTENVVKRLNEKDNSITSDKNIGERSIFDSTISSNNASTISLSPLPSPIKSVNSIESSLNVAHQAGYDAKMCYELFLQLCRIFMRNNPHEYKGDTIINKFTNYNSVNSAINIFKHLSFTFYNRLGRDSHFELSKCDVKASQNSLKTRSILDTILPEPKPNIYLLTLVDDTESDVVQTIARTPRLLPILELNLQFKTLLEFHLGKVSGARQSPDLFPISHDETVAQNSANKSHSTTRYCWKDLKILLDIIETVNKHICVAIDWESKANEVAATSSNGITNPLTSLICQSESFENLRWKYLVFACPNHKSNRKLVSTLLRDRIAFPSYNIYHSYNRNLASNTSKSNSCSLSNKNVFFSQDNRSKYSKKQSKFVDYISPKPTGKFIITKLPLDSYLKYSHLHTQI